MTHLLDSSAVLADLFGEPGEERVKSLIDVSGAEVGISVLTLFETYTSVLCRVGSEEMATEAVANLRGAVGEIVPVDEGVLNLALAFRRAATARIATVDCLIAATAALHGAVLVHRDPHFAALPAGLLAQDTLPDKGSANS